MSRILIIEDEEAIADLEKDYLELSGFEVEIENRGDTGLVRAMKEDFDLIILDLMLPEVDGFDICRQVREEKNTPIIMVSAKKDDIDKIRGLGLGADDYMTKPVNYEELIWRLDALLRRAHIASEHRIVVGRTVLDSGTYTVTREGAAMELPKKEFELLYKLLSYPGQIFTRNQLLDGVWGYDSESGEDTVKTHISRLRNKLRDIPEFRIVTIKGLGYKAEITKEEQP